MCWSGAIGRASRGPRTHQDDWEIIIRDALRFLAEPAPRIGADVARDTTVLQIAGQEVKLTTPGCVLYPATATTKAQVVAFYVEVAPAMLPHLRGRPATRKRWPEGVDGPAFFAKDLEPGTPAWLGRVQVQDNGPKFYPVVETPAALAWLGQVSALELHVPQWRLGAPTRPRDASTAPPAVGLPDRVVFDLDPGPGAGLQECVEVALALRDRLGPGARSVPVTSGSKGLHVYVPMDDPITSKRASEWARLVAVELQKALPELVVSRMAKSLRAGKVFVDWSQNVASKTTIAPYSLRGRERPTVAAPRTWDELLERGLRQLELPDVLERLRSGLDPLAGLHGKPDVAAAIGADAPPVSRPHPTIVVRRPRGTTAPANRAKAAGLTLPPGLGGPIAVELARPEKRLPGPDAMAGGSRYEPNGMDFAPVPRSEMIGEAMVQEWHRPREEFCSASAGGFLQKCSERWSLALAPCPTGVVDGDQTTAWCRSYSWGRLSWLMSWR